MSLAEKFTVIALISAAVVVVLGASAGNSFSMILGAFLFVLDCILLFVVED